LLEEIRVVLGLAPVQESVAPIVEEFEVVRVDAMRLLVLGSCLSKNEHEMHVFEYMRECDKERT
jgi:hypothetical protein